MVQCNITTAEGQAKMLAELRGASFDLDAKFKDARSRKFVSGIRAPDGRPASAEWQDKAEGE